MAGTIQPKGNKCCDTLFPLCDSSPLYYRLPPPPALPPPERVLTLLEKAFEQKNFRLSLLELTISIMHVSIRAKLL